jgi:hypothetical protein
MAMGDEENEQETLACFVDGQENEPELRALRRYLLMCRCMGVIL